MRIKKWQDELNEHATIEAFKEAYFRGAIRQSTVIRLANPHIDWSKADDEIFEQEESTRINQYYDETDPPETV